MLATDTAGVATGELRWRRLRADKRGRSAGTDAVVKSSPTGDDGQGMVPGGLARCAAGGAQACPNKGEGTGRNDSRTVSFQNREEDGWEHGQAPQRREGLRPGTRGRRSRRRLVPSSTHRPVLAPAGVGAGELVRVEQVLPVKLNFAMSAKRVEMLRRMHRPATVGRRVKGASVRARTERRGARRRPSRRCRRN